MDKKTDEALEKSIKKWEAIIAEKAEDFGGIDCALCRLFIATCARCPVRLRTGKPSCKGTPYADWYDHHVVMHGAGGVDDVPVYVHEGCPECARLAKEELDFLKSLRTKRQIK